MFTAADAASQLNTDGKTLRRFLRQDATYVNAGSGGRYMFAEADIPALTERFIVWRDRPKTTSSSTTLIVDNAGLTMSVARNDPAAVRAITEQRVDRLEAALKATGLHISQMKEFGAERRARVQAEALTA